MVSLDPIRDIIASLNSCVKTELGEDWKEIAYLDNVEKNDALSRNKVFGIRPLDAVEADGVNRFVTLDQTFELVLVRSKLTKATGDSEFRELSYDNRRDALCIYRKIASTNTAGLGLLAKDLIISEPEFIEESKTVVQRATFSIKYRTQI